MSTPEDPLRSGLGPIMLADDLAAIRSGKVAVDARTAAMAKVIEYQQARLTRLEDDAAFYRSLPPEEQERLRLIRCPSCFRCDAARRGKPKPNGKVTLKCRWCAHTWDCRREPERSPLHKPRQPKARKK